MPQTGLIIGDEFIPAEKTFISPSQGIHLPEETVIELVNRHNLEIFESGRTCTEYLFKYTAKLRDIDIYFITKEVRHSD